MDFERLQHLPTIIMLGDIIRKWWGLELCFVDPHGSVHVPGARGNGHGALPPGMQDAPGGPGVVGAPLHVGGAYRGLLYVDGAAPLSPGERERLHDLLALGVRAAADASLSAGPAPAAYLPEAGEEDRYGELVGRSGAMREVFRMLEKVAQSDATVLVQGESGTGKELVARALHERGPRCERPFVAQNCSALNDNLLESALFGHVRGAFTGAMRDRKGLFEVADGGTFFLDEVGDMSPALQVKLLRVLQEGTFLAVGDTVPREVQVRVIAATHKDLATLVSRGEFREDLYYRLNVIRVQVPPLRERKEDLPLLVQHFLAKHRRSDGRVRGLTPETLTLLTAYSWPGNVRELENEVARLLVLGAELELLPAHLVSARIRDGAAVPDEAVRPVLAAASGRLHEAVEMLEREMIGQGLVRTRHNKSRLARELGISRSNLLLKIARYGLDGAAGSPHPSEVEGDDDRQAHPPDEP